MEENKFMAFKSTSIIEVARFNFRPNTTQKPSSIADQKHNEFIKVDVFHDLNYGGFMRAKIKKAS